MAAESDLLTADVAARDAALDVSRSFIVQAPAGSGKTELLIQRYLRLLAIVEEPEEILAITFTKKAAAEMRERVVRALDRAAAGDVPEAAHERTTWEAASAVLDRDRELGWELTHAPRRMRIQTLDAFCAGVARLLPVTSGLGSGRNVAQDHAAARLYEKAATATLDWLVEEGPASEAVETVLAHLDNNTGQYVRYVSDMLQSRDQWLQITGGGSSSDPESIRRTLEDRLADLIEQRLSGVRDRVQASSPSAIVPLLRYASSNLIEADNAKPGLDALSDAKALPAATAEQIDAWRRVAEFLLTEKNQWRKQVNVRQGFPPKDDGQKAEFVRLLGAMVETPGLDQALSEVRRLPDPHYSDEQWMTLMALFRLLPLAVSELKRVFSENGSCDHAEVAMAASAALGSADEPGELAMMLDYRISHLLVDEMQDTSIRQYGLLETLVAGWSNNDGRSFFCVGDPMQSIYRFRDAEVGQFIRAREHGLENLKLDALTLRRNFRSGEHLVHWFNTVFMQVFPDSDDPDAGAIGYSESVPVEQHRNLGEQSLHPLFDVDAAAEAEYTAELIERQMSASEADDIAVLVRSRTQLPELLAELRSRQIDYQAVEIDRLTDLPEIIDLLALTRSMSHLGDRAAWLGLLRSPLVGLSWSDLHALVVGDRGSTVWELLKDQERRTALSLEGQSLVADFMLAAEDFLRVDRFRSLRQRVERAWLRFDGPACLLSHDQLDNAYRFLDILERLETAGTLQDPARLQSALEAERVSSGADSACRVHVMTMHKAKGLQFNHVILPFLGRSTRGSGRRVLNWLNVPGRSGDPELLISPVGAGSEHDLLHRYIEDAGKMSDEHELDRLLYVACTRAQSSLQLVFNLNPGPDGEPGKPHKGALLSRLWDTVRGGVEGAIASPPEGSYGDEEPDSVLQETTLRRLDPTRAAPPVPELPGTAESSEDRYDEDVYQVQYEWVGAAARDAGTLVHKWLQKFAQGKHSNALSDAELRQSTTRRWAARLGVSAARLEEVEERVERALTLALGDDKGQWILGGEGQAELALTGVWRGEIRSIVIDRVRLDGDVHWIVDYKTSTHEGGGLDQFVDQEAARYHQQLERYVQIYRAWSGASNVRAALYFPMMQVFREVTVE